MVPETNGETSATGDQNARNESRRPTQVRYPDDVKRWLIGVRRRNDSRVLSTAAAEDGKVLILDSESAGEWMVRVPATRQAVMPGERFWTIPDNWEKRLMIANTYRPDEALYSIPESGVFVVVEPLAQKRSRKAGYQVKSVGDLDITYRPPNYDRLLTVMGKSDVNIEAVYETDQLIEHWSEFKVKYLRRLKEDGRQYAMSAVTIQETPTVDSWDFDPWEGEREQTLSEIISSVCDVDDDVSDLLAGFLVEESVAMPAAELTVNEDTRLPPGYRIQAAIERGSTPTDAVDNLTERFDAAAPMSSEAVREADDKKTWKTQRSATQQLPVPE